MRRASRALVLIVVLGTLVRGINLGAPPIGVHSWRQADTAAIARNFYEHGYRFAYPQVDWGGMGPGYVESEFPIYTYAVALGYGLLGGVQEWVGRLLSVVAFILAGIALYALVRRTLGSSAAAWSLGFFLLLPLNVFYGRALMPEAWMIAASVGGVYFFHEWIEGRNPSALVLAGVLLALAALIKLPALYLGLPVAWLAWTRFRGGMFLKVELWVLALGVAVAVAAWYWHAHQILLHGGLTFRIWEYGSDKWGNWSLVASWKFWNGVVLRSLAERWFTWAGFPILVLGLCLPRRTESERLFDWWLAGVLIYCVIVARGNFVHEYYQLPFLPVGVVYMGKVFGRVWGSSWRDTGRRVLGACLVAIGLLSAFRLWDYLRREEPTRSWEVALANEIRTRTRPQDGIVTVTSGNPTLLYLTHRRGWTVHPDALSAASIRRLHFEGARAIAGREAEVVSRIRPLISQDPPLAAREHLSEHGFLIELDTGQRK